MAWTQQAWRHSLAGLPDPSQAATELQWRASIANVPVPTDELAGPLLLDYDEALSLTITPLPDSGFTRVTRMAIANVPAINVVDSTARDGDVDTTISGFTVAFDGTVDNTASSRDGDIVVTLGAFSASMAGSFAYRHYFDITYSITPTWVVYAEPPNFGDIDITVSGFTTAFTGFALPPDSTQGRVSASLGAFTADLDGTYTSPPTFSGSFSLDLQTFNPVFRGTAFTSGTTGSLPLQIGSFSPEFAGTFEKWNTDGALNRTLGQFTCSIQGLFASSDSVVGLVSSQISGFTTSIVGSIDNAQAIRNLQNVMIDTPDRRIMTDSRDVRTMQ